MPTSNALAEGSLLDALQRCLDLGQRVLKLSGQHLCLAALSRHLARVGKIRVVHESALVASEAKLCKLSF